MFVVGLTGGIGSGKSTVTRSFSTLGINIIDADVIARDVVSVGSQALTEIANHFGPNVLLTDGSLDRNKVRDIIFSDPQAKKWLESLLHPKIQKKILDEIKQSRSIYTIVSAPLLIETGLDKIVDRVLVVDIPEAIQIERTTLRDKISSKQVQAIILSQVNRETRLKRADDIIDNSGSVEETKAQVEKLHNIYLTFASNKQES